MKNKYEVDGDVTYIYIVNRKGRELKVLIDTEDLPLVKGLGTSWFAHEDHGKGVFYIETVKTVNKKRMHIGLHRLVTNCPEGYVVDHINHDTFDNRKENLRIATQSENGFNRRGVNENNTSGVRGVSWHKATEKWAAYTRFNGERIFIGVYEDKRVAEEAVMRERNKLLKVVTE